METKTGMGCGEERGAVKSRVQAMLSAGSPRLALAVAMGVPLAPWFVPVVATFSTVSQAAANGTASQQKFVQDTLITRISYQMQNLNTPTSNFSSFAANQFALNSGITARMKVTGAPRFTVADDYLPITELVSTCSETCGWVLGDTNAIIMDFQSTMTLPFAPLVVTVTFHGCTTHWSKLVDMSITDALKKLEELGHDIGTYECLI